MFNNRIVIWYSFVGMEIILSHNERQYHVDFSADLVADLREWSELVGAKFDAELIAGQLIEFNKNNIFEWWK